MSEETKTNFFRDNFEPKVYPPELIKAGLSNCDWCVFSGSSCCDSIECEGKATDGSVVYVNWRYTKDYCVDRLMLMDPVARQDILRNLAKSDSATISKQMVDNLVKKR